MSEEVDIDVYPVEKYVLTLDDPVVNVDLAVQGFLYIVQSLGWSPTSDVEIYTDYDIMHDKRKTALAVRYIDIPNLTIKASNTTSAIHIRRPGMSPSQSPSES